MIKGDIFIKKYKLSRLNNVDKHILLLLSFILLSFISAMIFLKNNFLFNGNDTLFHFRRIMELKDSITHYNLLPNFALNNFHGSSVMILYPYLNLFPIIILSYFIKSKIILIYSFFIFNTFITLIISFYSSKAYSKSIYVSYIFAIIYSLSNVFLAYNFTNMDLGLVSSYSFLPLIIFPFIMIINGNKDKWINLSIGISLISFSHIPSLIIIILFLNLWILINIRNLNKIIIINLVKSFFLFIILSSIIWVPIVFMYLFNFHNIISPESVQLKNISLKIFLSGLYGSKNLNTIGLFPLITLFIVPLFYNKINKIDKQMYILSLIIILFILFFPVSVTSYKYFSFLNHFQYLYRIFIIPQLFLSFIFSLIIYKYVKKNKKLIFLISIIFISLLAQLIGQYTYIHKNINDLSVNYYNKNDTFDLSNLTYKNIRINNSKEFYRIINGDNEIIYDYIPKVSYSVYKYVNNDIGFYNDYNPVKINHVGYNTFNFFDNKDNNIHKLSLPLYEYNKEKLHVYLNNKPVNNYINSNGLITINNIGHNVKEKNKIYIKPSLNPFRIIGAALSIFGLILILIKTIKKKN